MKKPLIALCAALFAATALAAPAFAHGHGAGAASRPAYALCSVEGCNIAGVHSHDNVNYCGHYIGDGHDYHTVCNVSGCTLTANHEHDGVVCFPHNNGDGHQYHSAGHGGGRHHR